MWWLFRPVDSIIYSLVLFLILQSISSIYFFTLLLSLFSFRYLVLLLLFVAKVNILMRPTPLCLCLRIETQFISFRNLKICPKVEKCTPLSLLISHRKVEKTRVYHIKCLIAATSIKGRGYLYVLRVQTL